MKHDHRVDVTGRVPIGGEHGVATWVFAPAKPQVKSPVPLLFCLPGGSYTKAYWHLEVPGRAGYSFAEHFADLGMLVVAVDHLGVGESSRVSRAADLTPDVVAAANAATFESVRAAAEDGTLVPELGPIEVGPSIGVGHSMGAMLTIFQQSLFDSFDAIAPLGYGTIGPIVGFRGDTSGIDPPGYETVMEAARAGLLDQDAPNERTPAMRRHFYWDDVPEDVVAADDLTVTTLPGATGLMSIVPYIARDHARRVRCPVFIGLGERDSTCSHHDEPGAYESSDDVTFFLLRRSAHCHNTAGTRALLWDRLARWIRALQ